MPLRVFGRALRAVAKDRNDLDPNISKPIKALKAFAIHNEILEHTNQNLHHALREEKKTPQTEKTDGLFDKDNPREAQFSSPTKVGC